VGLQSLNGIGLALTVLQAPAPAHLIECGLPTEALLAQIAVAKYADGLPLYRQEAIYARDGVNLDGSLIAQWMGKVGLELQPLADYLLAKIKFEAPLIGMAQFKVARSRPAARSCRG
jgi:transposase